LVGRIPLAGNRRPIHYVIKVANGLDVLLNGSYAVVCQALLPDGVCGTTRCLVEMLKGSWAGIVASRRVQVGCNPIACLEDLRLVLTFKVLVDCGGVFGFVRSVWSQKVPLSGLQIRGMLLSGRCCTSLNRHWL
jgi:hypothetical protein